MQKAAENSDYVSETRKNPRTTQARRGGNQRREREDENRLKSSGESHVDGVQKPQSMLEMLLLPIRPVDNVIKKSHYFSV